MNTTKVSVVMSVYKDRGRLDNTIETVLSQSFKNFEFIIIDDGSPDQVLKKLHKFAAEDSRIRIVVNKENIGLTRSLHHGVSLAEGKYIARIDEGDLWDPEKLKLQVEFLENNPFYFLVGSQYSTYSNSKWKSNTSTLPASDEEIRSWLTQGLTPFTHPAILFKNEVNYNIYAETSQDFELYLRIYFKGKMRNIDCTLVSILVEGESISMNRDHEQFFNHLKMHYQFLDALKKKNNPSTFVSKGVNFKTNLYFESYRRLYMKYILTQINKIGKKSFMGRVLKNLLIPDMMLYTCRKKILSIVS